MPWSTGGNDPNAEGEQSSFDFKAGPGVRMSAQDIEGVLIRDASAHQLPHRTHRFKKDFEAHGYTDRCPGCSAMLREMHPQPHSDACRIRLDACMQQTARES